MLKWHTFVQPPRQGTSHKKHGNSPCQDKATVKENGKLIAAVLADGLGSLEYSSIAAETITGTIASFLLNYDYRQFREERLKSDVLAECENALNKCSGLLNISITKMDCTLLFVVVFKRDSFFIIGQLGDGAICVVKQNQAFQFLALDDKHMSSSNMTKTVLSSDASDYFILRSFHVPDCLGVFITSDGLENELYSKAGRVKQNIQWYYNLIGNNDASRCVFEIGAKWDELASDDKFGFTDDMSLIAIIQPNKHIELPEEANWLCICGHRNRMESSRCESCGKDITKIYKGVSFKQNGGKLEFFSRLNGDPDEEARILRKYCVYK